MTERIIPLDLYPMGAKADEKRLEVAWTSDKYIAERKHDGRRYLMIHDVDDSVRVTSRQKSTKTGLPVDKTECVPHLVQLMKDTPLGTVIDGEIITRLNCNSNEVGEFIGCDPKEAIKRQAERGFLKFVAYDILYLSGASMMEQNQMFRKAALQHLYGGYLKDNDYIILSEYRECDKSDIHAWYEEIVEGGGEGLVLKYKNAKYQLDKKPVQTWIKAKKYITVDAVIMGFKHPEESYTGKEATNKNGVWLYWEDGYDGEQFLNTEGIKNKDISDNFKSVTKYWFYEWIGSVIFGQYNSEGKLIEVGSMSGMDEEVRKYLSEHQKDSIGRVVEIKAMERIKKTLALRHPVWKCWRDDKNPEDCVIEEQE